MSGSLSWRNVLQIVPLRMHYNECGHSEVWCLRDAVTTAMSRLRNSAAYYFVTVIVVMTLINGIGECDVVHEMAGVSRCC